jgi:hypothetical protein
MQTPRAFWFSWAETLRRAGLDAWAAFLIEAGAPLGFVGSQLLIMSQPFLRPAWHDDQIVSLAFMLEDQNESRAFAAFLRKGSRL